MLKSINITNYALISSLEIDFNPGFSVMTGETGAGKSIIIGALSLISGQRADNKSLKSGAQKCIVEAVFDVSEYPGLMQFFKNYELDYDPNQCYIRRELTSAGKSRAFINDTPVSLNLLRDLSGRLIDIHSQHENLMLMNPDYQLDVIDTVASNADMLKHYFDSYQLWRNAVEKLDKTQKEAARALEETDFVRFQFEQLNAACLLENEQEELESELAMLSHAGEIKTQLERSTQLIEGEGAAIVLLKESLNALDKVSGYIPGGSELYERYHSAWIEIKDICDEMRRFDEQFVYDPNRMEQVENRLSELFTLQKKHQVNSVAELIEKREMYGTQLQQILSFDDEILKLQKDCEEKLIRLKAASADLSQSRKSVIAYIEKFLAEQLVKLGMPHVRFEIRMMETEGFHPKGCDQLQFYFSANKNRDLQPVDSIASGGEVSRLMLSVKALIAGKCELPTIILDEIDVGVSGEIAHRMSEIMAEMGKMMQVISITHLPQIAARGVNHYKVYKDETTDVTETHIRLLTKNERIEEVASMISGEQKSEASLQNARELLGF